jgi:hypothetical protein
VNWSHLGTRVITDRWLAFGVLGFAVAFAITAVVAESPAYGIGAGMYAVVAVGWFVTHRRVRGAHERPNHRATNPPK